MAIVLMYYTIVRFTLNSSTRIIELFVFLSQFSTTFHEILHTLFSIHVVTTLKISQSFDKYDTKTHMFIVNNVKQQ